MIHKIYDKFPFSIKDDVLYIPLIDKNHSEPKYCAKASIEDKDMLLQYSFSAHLNSANVYARSNNGKMMHVLIMGEKVLGYVIDHIDIDGLNNTRENLRIVSKSQNSQNKKKKPGCKSQYIGVDLLNNKWKARIRINGKQMHLGLFQNEEDAGKAYDIHAINHFGINCQTNKLLSEKEIESIIEDRIPEGWERKTKKDKDLPTYILRAGRKYQVQFRGFKKNLDTLEEAIELKDILVAKEEAKNNNKKEKEVERRENILRNSEGYAIINIRDSLKNIIYEIIVDDHVWGDVSSRTWSFNQRYAQTLINNKTVLMHRYIHGKYAEKIPKYKTIDHIDSVRVFDNRLCNLRIADSSLQNHNKSKCKYSIDKYKGVYFDGSLFVTLIQKKSHGSYKTAEEAALKANEIFRETYGENAYQNQIDFSVQTTKENRIKEEITEEYIMNIKYIKDLRNIIMMKKLNIKAGGPLNTKDLKRDNLDEYKLKVISLLFDDSGEI